MECTIKGKFKFSRAYQGKTEIFHTLEEFSKKYPLRIQIASEKELFRDVGEDDVIELECLADMREFVRAGSRNVVFYVIKIDYEVFAVNLIAKKGGEK